MTMWSQIAHQVGRKDFEEFGRRIGLGNKLIKRELDEFVKEKPLVQVLIDRSFLSEELKSNIGCLWGTGVRCFLSDEGRIKHSSGKYFSFSHTGHTVKTD